MQLQRRGVNVNFLSVSSAFLMWASSAFTSVMHSKPDEISDGIILMV